MTDPRLNDLKAIVANLIATSERIDDEMRVVRRSYLDALVAEVKRLDGVPVGGTFIIKAAGTINGERCALYWSEPFPGMAGWTAEQSSARMYTTREEADGVLPNARKHMLNPNLTIDVRELA